MTSIHRRTAVSAALLALFSTPVISAESTEQSPAAKDDNRLVTIGTRVSGRTQTQTAAPVDVVTQETIRNSGIADTAELIRALVPSFNMNNTTTSDGQDLMRPASLRSMGPDQVLVLVNGKRRHQQAIVAVQQNVGRGNTGTDLNAIPVTAISRIEVLRDGAAAQYGSDAIAGVINILLKDDLGTRAWARYGQTSEGDGENRQVGINTGFGIGEGSVNLSLEWQDKGEINRAAKSDWFGSTSPERQLLLVGEAPVEALQLWFNAELPLAGGEFYAFGGTGEREAESLGFFRAPGSSRVWDNIYPNGITPKLGTQSEDDAYTLGYRRFITPDWEMDVSYGYGENRFEFRNLQSLNASYGPDSPTSAYDGAITNKLTVLNLDFTGSINWGVGQDALNLAVGAEYREDGYEIEAGDEVAYARGDTPCAQNSTSTDPNDPGCVPTTPGMQGFQGYRPEFEIDTDRDNVAIYADAESLITEQLLLGAAIRFEDYSDFGNTTIGKLSARYELNEDLAVRTTYSTGFRAPGIQQRFFTQRSISLDSDGNLADLVTLRPDSALAQELGFTPLKEETSDSFSIGLVYTGDIWTSTLDVYQINIEDRIIYSQAIGRGINAQIDAFFDAHAATLQGGDGQLDGVSRVEVFTNAADTETFGFDWVNQWRLDAGNGAEWLLEASLHHNDTEVTSVNTSSSIVPNEVVFDAGQRNLIEEAQPGERATLGATYRTDVWGSTLRANYYGEYSDHPTAYGLGKHTFGAKTLFDLTGYYDVNDAIRLSVGLLNLLDEYPDKWGSDGSPFSDEIGFTYGWNTVPFGLAGRNYYVKAEMTF